MTVMDAITLGIAVLGAVLGVMSMWRDIDRDRVKLRVSPKWAEVHAPGEDPTPRLCIEVLNLSAFPVTVCEVGLTMRGLEGRLVFITPILYDRKPWPRRLEPREAVSVYCSPQVAQQKEMLLARKAYAKTECGFVRTGSSPALANYLAEIAKLHAEARL